MREYWIHRCDNDKKRNGQYMEFCKCYLEWQNDPNKGKFNFKKTSERTGYSIRMARVLFSQINDEVVINKLQLTEEGCFIDPSEPDYSL